MKKFTFLLICLLSLSFANAQLNTMAIVGDGAGGWPGDAGNPGPTDVNQMTSTDNENWTINNLTLTTGDVKFRGNNSWDSPYNWGGSSFPSGTASESGTNISSISGVYNVSFNSNTFAYTFTLVTGSGLTSLAIVGDGAGGWPGNSGNPGPIDVNQMGTTDGVNWTINNLSMTNGSVKFRGNNSYDSPYNWGGPTFPSGTGSEGGADIQSTSGIYDVSFNSNTFAYTFTFVAEDGLTSVAIVGDGAGGWPGDAGNPGPEDVNQMTSTDGVNWLIENITLTLGFTKFRGNNSWDSPFNWGGTDFPSGTAAEDSGDNIPTTAGIYNLTFNSDTFVYNFSEVLSVEDFDIASFIVYPNPSKLSWNIKSEHLIKSVEIFNALGKRVLSLKTESNFITIDNNSLQTGIYFAKITSNLGVTSLKLLKE